MLMHEGMNFRVLGDSGCAVRSASIWSANAAADGDGARAGRRGGRKLERGIAYIDVRGSGRVAPKDADGFVMLVPADDRSNEIDPLEAMNAANASIARLQSWDSALKDAILNSLTLADLAVLGQQVIPHEFSYIDFNLTMLMNSSGYTTVMQHKVDDSQEESAVASTQHEGAPAPVQDLSFAAESMLPQHVALDLIEEDRFEKASAEHEPFYYERNDGTMVYCINTHIDDRYLARFVVRLLDGSRRLHPGEEQLVVHFDSYVKMLYGRLATGSGSLSRQDDVFHRLLRSMGDVDLSVNPSTLHSAIAAYGWSIDDTYVAMWFEFMDNVSWSNAGFYMACQLESQWRNSCAVAIDNGILWVLDCTMMSLALDSSPFRKAFTKLLADYVCKCGVSASFDDLSSLPVRWREARLALRYGSIHDATRWHYSLADYKLEHILDSATSELLPEQVCSKKLMALVRHDEGHSTEYSRTLVSYLRNDCSATRTSDELFIHRTTLLRRLEGIRKIAKIDFSNSDEKAFLLMSAKLLGM